MRYSVPPGLYALGRAGPDSPVFVSANYRLSFDHLRRELGGPGIAGAWILVLDTRGINVWCAAGAGFFCSEELVLRLETARLAEVVTHRTLILPQLAGPGVSAPEVERRSGFRVRWGPVRAGDIPAFLESGMAAAPEMRRVRFGLRERLVLVPMQLGQSLLRYPAFALAAFVLAGVTPRGVAFPAAWAGGLPLLLLGLLAVFSGSVGVPLLPPGLPPKSFVLRGWLTGAVLTAVGMRGIGLAAGMDPMEAAACWAFFPAASAAMALGFTGATPYTSRSGVEAELRVSLPFLLAAAVLTLAALVLWKLRQWGALAWP
jgi:hypothetical protein